MAEDYVSQNEFNRVCDTINGSLKRIEDGVNELRQGQNELSGCVRDRVPFTECNRRMDIASNERERLRGRPSWAVAVIISILSTGVVTLLALYLTHVI